MLINDPGQDEDEEDSDCEMEDDSAGQDVVPRIKSYKEAIMALEDVAQFLQHKGNPEEDMCNCSVVMETGMFCSSSLVILSRNCSRWCRYVLKGF